MASYDDDPDTKGKKGDEKLISEARKYLKQCIDDEAGERAKMLDDLRFCTLDQWPGDIRRERENDQENGPRPCLTIDKINQYIVQVVNDVRQGKPGIVVRPQDDSADVETARIIKGLIRNIEDQSKADVAYACAVESAARIGLGYWRIIAKYVSEDSFDQDLFIEPIPNTFAVHLGPHHMPDGSDAKRAFIGESMPVDKFRAEYPKAKFRSEEFEDLQTDMSYWHTGEAITVLEYYCLEREKDELHFLEDGTTISEREYKKWPEEAGPKPAIVRSRDTYFEQLKWVKMTGIEVLEKRDLPGSYIPIVEVVGREAWVDGKRSLWGLVRPAKDSLRMYNYWASTITEKMALQPKVPWVGAVGQFATAGDRWRKSNRVNYAYLEYDPIDVNGNAIPAPMRQGASPMESAMLQQMQVIEHDVQVSLGIFKAAVGESESQQSGKAILALQRESDTGTYHFGANLGQSIRHTGKILLDMIPHYYDTKRIVRILGEDGEVQTAMLDPNMQAPRAQVPAPQGGGMMEIFNPTIGKYDISITVGPSYATKRMEAAATFVEMAKGAADPASAAILRYLVLRNSDTAGSEEAAKLLKTMLPPPALQALESKDPIPPQVQAQMQQMQMQMAQAQEQMQKLGQENMQLKAGAQAKAMQTQADHDAEMKKLELERQVETEKAQLKRWVEEQQLNLKAWVAEQEARIAAVQAGAEEERMNRKQVFDEDVKRREIEMQDRVEEPRTVQAITQMVQQFEKALQGQQEALGTMMEQMIAQIQKPRAVSISNVKIQRTEQGITGASATVQ